jgi:hypothetical protein
MKTLAVIFAFLLVVTGTILGSVKQTVPANSNETLSSNEAVQIMRAVNTAEAETIALSKHGLDMGAVRQHRFVKKLDPQIALNSPARPDSVSVKGYEVRLLLAQDQQHYTLTIRPLQLGECTPVFMTDESGVFYDGVPASCQQSSRIASN